MIEELRGVHGKYDLDDIAGEVHNEHDTQHIEGFLPERHEQDGGEDEQQQSVPAYHFCGEGMDVGCYQLSDECLRCEETKDEGEKIEENFEIEACFQVHGATKIG